MDKKDAIKEYENKWTFFSAEDCDIVLAPNKIITQ